MALYSHAYLASNGDACSRLRLFGELLVDLKGIEPIFTARKAVVLPLNERPTLKGARRCVRPAPLPRIATSVICAGTGAKLGERSGVGSSHDQLLLAHCKL